MEPNESVEYFPNKFLHLCYKCPEEDMDQYFLKQNFKNLVHISMYCKSKPLDVFSSLTHVNQETSLILEEELLPLLFLVLLIF